MQRIYFKKALKRYVVLFLLLVIIVPPLVIVTRKIISSTSLSINSIFVPRQISCTFINISSEATKQQIKNIVQSTLTRESLIHFDANQFYKTLEQQFPIIKTMVWKFQAPNTLALTITGAKPIFLINNTSVMGNKKHLIPPSFFDQNIVAQLPQICVEQNWINNNHINIDAYKVIRKLTNYLWTTYKITFHNTSNIELAPFQSICPCNIIADYKTLFDKKRFESLSPLFQDLQNRGLITKKMLSAKGPALAFDMRIKNQIIVKFYEPIKRGMGL